MSLFYVSPAGNDSNPGTIGSPKLTVAAGVALASAGDTVYLRGGTYTGADATIDSQGHTVNSGSSFTNAVTISGYPSETAIIQPSSGVSAVRLYTAVSYIIIQDLTLDMVSDATHVEAVILSLCSHIRIQRCDVKNGSGFGIHSGSDASFLEILDNLVHNFGYGGSIAGDCHGLYMTGSDALFEGNEVYDNDGYGFHIYNNSGPHTAPSRVICRKNKVHDNGVHGSSEYGIVIGWGSDNVVENNIVYSNAGGIQVYTSSTNAKVYHNTVYGNTGTGIGLQYYANAPTIRNNISWSNGGDGNIHDYGVVGPPVTPVIDHNLTTDPSFTDAGAGDFTLQAGSAAIDAGVTIAAVTDDYLGNLRPAGLAYDIGAYEFGGVGGGGGSPDLSPAGSIQTIWGRNTHTNLSTTNATDPFFETQWFQSPVNTINRVPWCAEGTAGNLGIRLTVAPGSGKSRSYTLYVNGSASALTVTISDAATSAWDTTHVVALSVGDLVEWVHVATGSPAACEVSAVWEFTSTIPGHSAFGFACTQLNAGAAVYHTPFTRSSGNWTISSVSIAGYQIVGVDGALVTYRIRGEPGFAGDNIDGAHGWRFLYQVDGVLQNGSGGTVDTRATMTSLAAGATWTGTLPLLAGQQVRLVAQVIGTPNACNIGSGCGFVADTPGQYFVVGDRRNISSIPASATRYTVPISGTQQFGLDATESDVETFGGLTTQTFSGLWVLIGTSSVTGGIVFSPRVNNATPVDAPSVTVSGISNFQSGAGIFTLAQDETWTLRLVAPATSVPAPTGTWTFAVGLADSEGSPGAPPVDPEPIEPEFLDGAVSYPLTMLDLTDRVGTRHVFAEVDLNDAADYYGGYKRPWALHFKTSRGLSDRTGQMEHSSFSCQLSDTAERFFRGLLGGDDTKFVTNRPLAIWMIDDRRRRLEQPWRLTANGFVAVPSPEVDMTFGITGTDWLKARFTQKRAAGQAWQPTITIADFPTCPEETIGKAAQVIYGAVNDVLAGRGGVAATYVGRRGADAVGARVTLNTQTGHVGTITAEIHSYITCVVGGVEGPLSSEGGNLNRGDFADPHGIRANWGHVDGVDSYRIYFFWGPSVGGNEAVFFNPLTGTGLAGGVCRVFTHDNATYDGFGALPSEDFYVQVGSASDGAAYSGPFNSGSGDHYHEWLIAAHACKDLIGGVVYIDGRPTKAADLAGDLYIPGTSQWTAQFGATPYVDINTHRYTILRGVIGATTTEAIVAQKLEITLNVEGVETVGDSSGALIISPPQQAHHFAQNYLAPADPYRGGLWLGPTYFEHPPELTKLSYIDDDTFDVVETALAARLAGGYDTCGVIGAQGALEGGVEVLARIAMSGDFDLAFSRKGQLIASAEPIASVSVADRTTELLSIHESSFTITDEVESNFFNILPYSHTIDFTAKGETHTDELKDDASIGDYQEVRLSSEWIMSFCRVTSAQQAATLVDSLARKLARFRDPRRRVTFTLSLEGLNHDLGDVLSITHVEGVSDTGWLDHLVRCVRHEVDPTDGTVVLDCYDIEPLFGVGLSDEVKAALVADLMARIVAIPVTPPAASPSTIPPGLPGAVGTGDVVGPSSATDNAIVRFDGTTGKLIQNSGITIADGASGTLAGSNSGDQTITLTGDVTGSGTGSFAATIANDAVTNTKAANMAQSTIKGRAVGAGTGDPTDLTATQATAILDTLVGDSGSGGTKGLAPAPVAGDAAAGKFLKADGSYAVPPGTGAGTVTTSGSPASGNLTKFSGASAITNGDLSGDVTTSGTLAATIANDAVSYAKMQNVAAASRLLGRGSAGGSGDVEEITPGNNLSLSGTTLHVARALTFGMVMDDGTGVALTVGVKGFVRIPVACTITKWTVLSIDGAATAGSISIDLWRDTLANYPPVVGDSIVGGGTKPALSSANAAEGSSLGGWTSTAIVAGDIIGFAAEATPATVTRVLVEIEASVP